MNKIFKFIISSLVSMALTRLILGSGKKRRAPRYGHAHAKHHFYSKTSSKNMSVH